MGESRSAWFYVGIGCAAVAVIGVVVVVGGGVWLYQKAKDFRAELEDPDARAAKVRKILHADELPEGYHPMIGFSVPFVMDVAILSDEEPRPDGKPQDLGKRALIYFQMVRTGQDEQALRDYFEGRTSDPAVLRENKINVDVEEIIRRGVLELEGETLMYLAQRGSVSTSGYRGSGVTAIVLIDCPADRRTRMAVWITPDEAAGTPVAEVDWTGTPADPDAIAAFLSGFDFCATGG